MVWHFIGSAAAVLTMFSFVPQIIKAVKTKSLKDISVFTLVQFSFGVALWLVYGLYLGNVIIIIANGVSLISLVILLTLYCIYKAKK